jgi:hypothetical protein
MESILKFIQDNISWIKDVFTIVFVGTATVIGLLTYRRAKATLLQPIRNEVVKKQSEMLTEMLSSISEKQSLGDGFDYIAIASANAILALRDYGFIFKNAKEVRNEVEPQIVGWMPVGESKILKDVEVVRPFPKERSETQPKSDAYGKERFDKAKGGVIEIDKIYLTKRYSEFQSRLALYSGSPFLPEHIQQVLDKIILDADKNLSVHLKFVLEEALKRLCKVYFERGDAPIISPTGLYNEFNHVRVHHRVDFELLKSAIRKYLRIDEAW